MCRFLLQDGLSVEILQSLSFRTNLGLSLKTALRTSPKLHFCTKLKKFPFGMTSMKP